MKPGQKFLEKIPPVCRQIVRVVEEWGGSAYLVGGLVRDLLLKPAQFDITAPDWDIAVDLRATGQGLLSLLKKINAQTNCRYVFYNQFLTGTLLFGDLRVDIAHTRDESYPAPAVLPLVRPAGIEQDLRRRDFTINALALTLTGKGKGEVVDPTGGQQDLQLRLVRIIHPNSFIDDPTRIFRCIRFAIRLGFEIESGTLYLLRAAVKNGYPARLTPERILYELRCICRERAALKMLEAVVKEGVLASCWQQVPGPEFFGFPVKRLLAELQKLVQAKVDSGLLFVYLLSRLPVNTRFPITREEREAQQILRESKVIVSRLRRVRKKSAIYRQLVGIPVPALQVLKILTTGVVRQRLRLYLEKLLSVQPQLQAADLISAGIKPGPELGRMLERLRAARLDGQVKTTAQEWALVQRIRGKNV